MRHNAVIRLSLAALLPLAMATACTDSGISGLASGDDAPGTGGAGTSGGTNTQGAPTAADTFSLTVHVTVPSTSGDTLHGTPVAGASVTLTRTEWTFIHGNGADTMSGHTVTVGTKTTDANGDVQFDRLPGDLYRVAVTRSGSTIPDSVVSTIELLHVAKGFLPITLRP
jgi:hypothetical protein